VRVDARTEDRNGCAFGGAYLADCLYVKTEFSKPIPTRAGARERDRARHAWLKTASIDEIVNRCRPNTIRPTKALSQVA